MPLIRNRARHVVSSNIKTDYSPQRRLKMRMIAIAAYMAVSALMLMWRNLDMYEDEAASNRQMSIDRTSVELQATPTESKPPPTIIFYNIFVPDDNLVNLKRIVSEQLGQAGESDSSIEARHQNMTLSVRYVTIGRYDFTFNQVFLPQECAKNNLQCTHVRHVPRGFEEGTLSALRDFCVEHPKWTVTYIHAKGSFHSQAKNDPWRKFLTAAALSRHCMSGMHNDTCNLCGLQFFASWTPFIPGNMWSARCSYVRQLLPLSVYADKLVGITRHALELRLRGQVVMKPVHDHISFFGLGRFAAEHWVAAHPDVQPCDCDTTGNLTRWRQGRASLSELKLGKAPRHPGTPFWKWIDERSHPNAHLRDYFLMPGNLLKWFQLYGYVPNNSSWVWNWYPGGQFWHSQLQLWGPDEVVERATDKHMSTMLKGPGAFVQDGDQARTDLQLEHSAHGIFYSAYIARTVDNAKGEMDFITKQIEMVDSMLQKAHGNDTSLFYRVMGHQDLRGFNICHNTSMQKCYSLGYLDDYYAGETLLDIQAFCRRSPTSKVSMIHNIAPREVAVTEPAETIHRFLRHTTRAVMDHRCYRVSSDKCNVCGLAFYTEPKLAMAGDMWTASCSYINRLHSPVVFQDKMNEFIVDAHLLKLQDSLSMRLYKTQVDVLGLDKFSMEHWIGSHPSLMPCDLADRDISDWLKSGSDSLSISLGIGARHQGAPFGKADHEVEKEIMQQASFRRREFYFLAGQLEKWYSLYGEVPGNSSWVWDWFPDGPTWRVEVALYGRNTVRTVTATYVPSARK